MISKILKTMTIASTLVFAAVLWATREEWMVSQSAFALSPNNHWYFAMHASIALTFILDWLHYKRVWSLLVALATAGIVAFDMYNFPMVHNIFTGTMAILAVGNVIYYATTKERPFAIMNSFVGTLVFLLGWLAGIHLFFGEVIIEFTLGLSIIRRIWK